MIHIDICDAHVGDAINTLSSVILPVLKCLTSQSTTRMQLESFHRIILLTVIL